jgi:outer membrane protein TolC
MLRKRLLAVLSTLFIFPISLSAQSSTLDISEVLKLVLERNAAVQIADALERQAEALHRQTLGDTKPQIDLKMDPAYGYSTGFAASVPYITPPGPESKSDVSLGLSLSQALPTAGIASLSLANTTSFTRDPKTVVQSPSATFVLSQPVWVNKKLFDLSQLSAAKRVSEINWRKAQDDGLKARNGNIYAAFSLYTEVIGLQRNIEYLEKSLELADQNLRQVRINLGAGRASETDLLELEILSGLQREALLESRYALLRAEQALANALGLKAGLSVYEYIESFPAPALPADTAELVAEARTNNPVVRQDRLAVEQAEAQDILSGRTNAPNLSIALTMLPQYEGTTPTEFSDSFSSFFSEGTELDWSVAIGLEVPLYNGGKRTYREQVNAATERIARETLEASRRDVENTYEALVLRQRIIDDRINLLEKNIELKRRTVADEQRKLEVGLGTSMRVESARLELLKVQNELWQTQADLFLNSLDLLNLSGRSLEKALAAL